MKNPLKQLSDHGQSVWIDTLSRRLITRGELQRLVEMDGVRGLTSNPSILQRALAETDQYRDILEAEDSQGLDAKALYERIAVRDIRDAADVLLPVHRSTSRRDGYVSLEVSPLLAHDTAGTVAEARRLWRLVDRENLMIKVPATPAGIKAVRQLIGEGLNINVTLLFSTGTYEQVFTAYMDGLEERLSQGGDPGRVASVASFFVSRIDTAVDRWIGERIRSSADLTVNALLHSLLGKVACANARTAYHRYLAMLGSARWQDLSRQGARSQRLLWASTGTKNRSLGDVYYVEELIGPDTVTTLPPTTLDAFHDHGRVRASLTESPGGAAQIMEDVHAAGVPFHEITDRLLADGLEQFTAAFERLVPKTRRVPVPISHDSMDHLRIRLFKELHAGGQPH